MRDALALLGDDAELACGPKRAARMERRPKNFPNI
jgi:hypothetical protein